LLVYDFLVANLYLYYFLAFVLFCFVLEDNKTKWISFGISLIA